MAGLDGKRGGRADAPDTSNRHAAFISYSQADKAEVKKLQHWLETYRLPKALRAGAARNDRKLGRIFRDDEDMSAASDIASQVRAAIENSDALVVACSPRAAKSKWVEAEIQHFRKTGREGKIFAVILDGEPNSPDPERECFPPSFRRGGVAGDPSMMPSEPLALDMQRDGRERVRARLAAGLLGVDFDEIWNRERRRQRARATLAGGLLAAGAALTATAGVATWLALDNNAKAEMARMEAETARVEADVAKTDAETNRVQAEGHLARAMNSEVTATDALQSAIRAQARAEENLARAADERSATFASEADKLLIAGKSVQAMLVALLGDPSGIATDKATKALRPHGYEAARAALSRAFVHAPLSIIAVHSDRVRAVAFSPDGAKLVTASDDRSAVIWNASNGTRITRISGHADAVNDAVYSPDGSLVATASDDKTAAIWNPQTGERLVSFPGHAGPVNSVAFSPDAKLLSTTSDDGTLRLWSSASGEHIATLSIDAQGLNDAEFSPDGAMVAMASNNGRVVVWDVATRERLLVLAGHTSTVHALSFSPDGARIATASHDRTARLWDTETGALVAVLAGHSDTVFSVDFSPDGGVVITGGWDETRVWDARTGIGIATLPALHGTVWSAALSPDASVIATASNRGNVSLWRRPDFHLLLADEQVKLACARLKEFGVYDFAPEERAKLLILKGVPLYPCGAPPPGVPAWPKGGPKY